MCTRNKRHPDWFNRLPGEHSVQPETYKNEDANVDNAGRSPVERQLEFLHHLHV